MCEPVNLNLFTARTCTNQCPVNMTVNTTCPTEVPPAQLFCNINADTVSFLQVKFNQQRIYPGEVVNKSRTRSTQAKWWFSNEETIGWL